METTAERVAKGAALLDEKIPRWWDHVDLNSLEMRSTCGCVLGQVFGAEGLEEPGYWIGLDEFGIRSRPASYPAGYGFACETNDDHDYAALQAEWRRLIEARRAAS